MRYGSAQQRLKCVSHYRQRQVAAFVAADPQPEGDWRFGELYQMEEYMKRRNFTRLEVRCGS
jgi:hypothetical protein